MSKILDIETLRNSMRVTSVTSSYSSEAKQMGIKSSSFVSYTVKSESDAGWTLDEARLVEAILAERVSKDLYADLGARQQAPLQDVKGYQQNVSSHYAKITSSLIKKLYEDEKPLDIQNLIQKAKEMSDEG